MIEKTILGYIFVLLAQLSAGLNSIPVAVLTLTPSSTTIPVGQTFTVDINLDTKGAAIDGVDIYSLRYNPAILEVVDSNTSQSGIQIIPGTLLANTLTNTVNASNGTIQFSQVTAGGSTYTGSGKLASITFKAKSAGTSALTFDFTLGNTSDTNVAGAGQDKLASVTNGSFTVTGGTTQTSTQTPVPDTTSPTISNVNTSNITQSSVSINWTTNEPADSQIEFPTGPCPGGSNCLTPIVSSLTTSHTVNVSNLNPNTFYTYRIKSRDGAGNLVVTNNFTFTTPTPTPTPTSVSGPNLASSPSSQNVSVGQTFTVDINLDTKGAAIDGVDIYSLRYNPAILEVVDSNTSQSGIQIIPGTLLANTLTNTVNASNGTIQFSQVTAGGSTYTGSGKLASITFKAKSAGTSALTFDFTLGNTSDTNVAGAGQDKLASVTNGSFTVTGGTTQTSTQTQSQ